MLLRKIYENRSKQLIQLLNKPQDKLTVEERQKLTDILFSDTKPPPKLKQ